MPYDVKLESMIDMLTARWDGIGKKAMFGGIAYLFRGNMAFGIWGEFLIVRAGEEAAKEKLKEEHVRPFDVTGRPMAGWLMVDSLRWKTEEDLRAWLKLGLEFAATLPPK